MKKPTPEQKHMFRCYHKHFHPDKFVGHPHYKMVVECAVVVNRGYEECCIDFCDVVKAIGLMLKDELKGA